MLKKIYLELVAIRKELQAIRGHLELIRKHTFNLVTGFVRSPNYDTGEPKQGEPMEWRRFELLTESEAERERLERIWLSFCLAFAFDLNSGKNILVFDRTLYLDYRRYGSYLQAK